MSYDFVIVDSDKILEWEVPFSLDEHHEIVTAMATHSFEILREFSDYYAEGFVYPDKLFQFKEEIKTIISFEGISNHTISRLHDLLNLIERASALRLPIYGIAD